MTEQSLISELHPFAWPIVALILGLVAIFALRTGLTGLIGRLKNIKTPWGVVEASATHQQAGSAEVIRPFSDEALSMFDPALLQEQKNLLETEIDKRHIEPGAPRERELLAIGAAVILVNGFERTYFAIFGSQLGALQVLNSAQAGLPPEALRPWYDLAAIMAPETYANYSFEQWLSFLESSVLIRRNGPSSR